MFDKISRYASLVKFSHTVFALPFALVGYVYGLISTGTPFEGLLLVKILFCMVFARNTAMGFNRWADREIDAVNPRTADREIPAGKISPRSALLFTIANAIGFMIIAGFINRLSLFLAPVALFILLGYSYTKRFTAWSHLVLGTALAIAPAGAYIAVTGTLDYFPIILSGLVLTWVAGFDILYSLQDAVFDRENKLHSVPARFSRTGSMSISIILHLITVYAVFLLGKLYGAGIIYLVGSIVFTALLVLQHIVFVPEKPGRIAAGFGIINGISSVVFATCLILDLII